MSNFIYQFLTDAVQEAALKAELDRQMSNYRTGIRQIMLAPAQSVVQAGRQAQLEVNRRKQAVLSALNPYTLTDLGDL
jgi:hypothetical protein